MSSIRGFDLAGPVAQVWAVRISPLDPAVAAFHAVLSQDEKDRAARFRFEHLRACSVLARGALRILLGRYLDLPPDGIRLRYDARGKPSIAAAIPIEFNTSHSAGLAVFAFALGCAVGVDVERIAPLPDWQKIAGCFFSAGEAAELATIAPGQRECAFFLCWTRKESYVKMTGGGLSVPLDSFRVTLQPGGPVGLTDSNGPQACTMVDLSVAPEYAAALAYRDRPRSVHLRFVEPGELLGFL